MAPPQRQYPSEGQKSDPANVSEPTKEERTTSLVAAYAHGLENNAPRTPAELAELRFLLDHKGLSTITLTPEQYATRDLMVNINTPRMSVYDALNSHFEVGGVIPASIKTSDVTPAMIALYPDWKGHSFFAVAEEVFLVDPARKLLGIIAAPDRSKIVPPSPEQVKAKEAVQTDAAQRERDANPNDRSGQRQAQVGEFDHNQAAASQRRFEDDRANAKVG